MKREYARRGVVERQPSGPALVGLIHETRYLHITMMSGQPLPSGDNALVFGQPSELPAVSECHPM
jgi:hypothetical protein